MAIRWLTTDDIWSADTRRQLGLEPPEPQPPRLATIADDLAYFLRQSGRLSDLFGTEEVAQTGEGRLTVRYSTGYHLLVELTVQAPPPTEETLSAADG